MKLDSQPENSSNYEEETIMSDFRNGNKDAFRWIFERMVKPLNYYVDNIIHSIPDAEDIVANAFYKLFHRRERMNSYEHVKRSLYTIVRNEAIDYLRLQKTQREGRRNLTYLDTGFEELLETERVKAQLMQSILREIENLPKQRRTILQLYFFEQKTTGEIAELLQLNSQTVLNHKTKALEDLRKRGLKLKWLTASAPAAILINAFFLLK